MGNFNAVGESSVEHGSVNANDIVRKILESSEETDMPLSDSNRSMEDKTSIASSSENTDGNDGICYYCLYCFFDFITPKIDHS